MSPRSREELPVLRRSGRRASLSRLNSSLINWNKEKFSNSAFSINESERRPEKRSRKNDTDIQAQSHSIRHSSPDIHNRCNNESSSEEEHSSLQNNLKNFQTKKRTRSGNIRPASLSDVSMTGSSLRSSRLTRRSQLQNSSSLSVAEEEEQDMSDISSNRSETAEPEESSSVLSAEESAADEVVMSSSINESTGEIEEERTSQNSVDNEQMYWENVGETKADDDRVALEVRKRYEIAKSLCAEMKTPSFSTPEKSLLEQLLDQSDKYTEFMLARSLSAAVPQDERREPSALSRQSRGPRRQQKGRDREEELLMREADEELTGHQKGFWTRLSKQPEMITGGTLKPYQLEGLNWLIHLYESGINGILADEMGLGKTLQTIALLAYLKESRNIRGPHLILAPKSTLGNWLNEIKRFCPSLKAYRFHGTKEERREAKDRGDLAPNSKRNDVFITSYELCIREQAVFRKFNFRYIIVDEAHRIKNEASKLSKIIRTFKTQFRLLLTGTPLQNNLRELWALLNFLFPEMFASSAEFDRIFDLTGTFDDSSKILSSEDKTARNVKIVSRLHKILKPFLLRRLKAEVVVELPPKTELLLYIPLSKMQRSLYKDLLAKNVDFLSDTGGRVRLLNLAMQLRKACNHPYLFEGYEDKSLDPFGSHLITNSGKLVLLDRLLQKLISSGSRILIFTQMTRMLDILEDYCRLRAFSYCRLDGSSLGEERERQIEEFNAPDSQHSIFLLSTRAGGLGINLATADTVIIYDSDFNPQVDLQAMDRAHRIGQKRHVNVYRLVHEHTIEEKIIERAMLKLRLDTAVIQQGRLSDRHSQQISKTDLMRFIQFGADQIYKSSTNDITDLTDEDIELILQRGEERTMELSGRLESHLQEKATNLLDFDFSSVANLYEFEGVDYNADRHAWAEIGVSALAEERNAKRKVRVAQEQFEELQRQQQQMQLLSAASLSTGNSRNRTLKLPRMEEWQFFDRQRISELHDRELEFISTLSDGMLDDQKFNEKEEKEALLAQGFGDWSKKDFFNFVKSCETVGANNIEVIARDVGKSEEEVKRYLLTFLERYAELTEGEKWLRRVKSGDEARMKRQQMEQLLMEKLAGDGSWQRLAIKFPKSKTQFTDEEDRWLLHAALVVGYGNWERLQAAISADPCWMLNWFMRSRTPQDLGRRVEFLVRQIQKEYSEETETRSKTKESAAMKRSDEFKFYQSADEACYRSTILPAVPALSKRRPKSASGRVRKKKEVKNEEGEMEEVLRDMINGKQGNDHNNNNNSSNNSSNAEDTLNGKSHDCPTENEKSQTDVVSQSIAEPVDFNSADSSNITYLFDAIKI